MFLKFAFVFSLKFLNTHLPVECFQNLNRCAGVHVTNAKEAKETSVSQGSFYAWQAKLDHNARERARFGGTSHKTLYGAWGSSYYYKTLHKQTMIPGVIFAFFFIADIKVGEMYFWGQASQLLCSVSQDICPDGKENTIDPENIKNFGRGG